MGWPSQNPFLFLIPMHLNRDMSFPTKTPWIRGWRFLWPYSRYITRQRHPAWICSLLHLHILIIVQTLPLILLIIGIFPSVLAILGRLTQFRRDRFEQILCMLP